MIHVIILISVKDTTAFIEYETMSIDIMNRYGGKLVTAFEPNATVSIDVDYNEIHCLEFPDLDSFKQYHKDSNITGMSELRAKAISKTQVIVSGEIKTYATNVAYV